MDRGNPNLKGNIAEAAIAFEAARLGIPVFKPLYEHGRCDLILEIGRRLLRVQCKSAPRKNEIVVVRCVTNRRGPDGFIRAKYSADEIDALAVYCPENGECYLLPAEMVAGRSGFHLRLAPPRNAQIASVHYAADYRLGAIAQLGERRTGSPKVVGSSPTGSTASSPVVDVSDDRHRYDVKEVVGMDEFYARLAHYVRHAQAGNRVLVTRWGRPVAQLGPLQPQLTIVDPTQDVAQDVA